MATIPVANDAEIFTSESAERLARRPAPVELTTQQAADLLNLSRQYVQRLLDEGKIPSYKVGADNRVRLDDVLVYKQKSDADRFDALKQLVAEAQELNMGY